MEVENRYHSQNPKKIWVRCHRYDVIAGEGRIEECDPKLTLGTVLIQSDDNCKAVTDKLRRCFDLPMDGIVLKVRNNRHSLLPLNGNILSNSKTVPYSLEVMRVHQFVKPTGVSRRSEWYRDCTRKTINNLIHRVNLLETKTPELRENKIERIHQEMTELNQTLAFMNKRFDDVDGVQWEGMFTKHPLW